jgi:hypothetical protein
MSNSETTKPSEPGGGEQRALAHGEKAAATVMSAARALTAPLLIALVGISVLYPLWLHRGIPWSKNSDIVALYLFIQALAKDALGSEGCLAFWNPSMGAGLPAFADPQSMYLYPLNLVSFVAPIDVTLRTIIILNVLVAGLAMYLFSRSYCQRAAAFFCAIGYMLSYRYLGMIHAGWLPKLSMYGLVPLLFWSVNKVLEKPTARRLALFSVVIGLSLVQGDMQQLLYAGLGLGIYIWIRSAVWGEVAWRPAMVCLAIGGVLGAMLSGPALLPRVQYALLSTRAEANYEVFLSKPPAPADLRTLADPCDKGGDRKEFWENNFYFGLWAYPLLLFSFRKEWRRPAALVLATGAMILLCFDTPLLELCYAVVPGFKLFRQSSRLLILAQFVLVIGAGLGAESLLGGVVDRARWVFFSAGALAIMAAGIIAAVILKTDLAPAISAALIFVALLVAIKRQSRVMAVALLSLLPILDWTVRGQSLLAVKPLSEAAPRHPFHALVNRQGGRTLAIGRTSIPYGQAGRYDIDLINCYSAMTLRNVVEYLSIMQFGSKRAIPHSAVTWLDITSVTRPELLGALNVRFIVANSPQSLENIGFQKIAGYSRVPIFDLYQGIMQVPIEVWRSKHSPAPAYFASSVRSVGNEEESLDALVEATSVLDAHVMGLGDEATRARCAGGSVEQVYCGYNRYDYEMESQGDNYLILSQVWYPGWVAKLDGRTVKLHRTNHALTGCFVGPGRHRLILRTTSPMFDWGVLTACGAILILAIVLLLPCRGLGRV